MLIENCTFDTGDDCVVLKSGYNQDGWRVGRPT
jgi:polygalacturonase